MPSNTTILLLLFVLFAFCLSENGAYAFGAGNIPSFAYMEGKAFRHGDIEDILADLIKRGAGSGFTLASVLSKGHKFNGLDIKRVYFGNWLRDYSQAIDIAALKKVQHQTIINLCMALGFLAHGYATNEFEVTPERLGCYLPTEHIDNPKGYGEGEDARRYHAGLRGPVDPRELEIDPRTGMKNYIANDNGGWDTSKALVRRTIEKCIHIGRQHRSQGRKQDEYEAYRLLGQALHTVEDYPAHSNFCELALVSMGHNQVFTQVGDQVRIQAPSGKWVAPIVTGTFGSSDFTHSLLGEANDHLSQASVTDLNKELDRARSKSIEQSTRSGPGGAPLDPSSLLRQLFSSIPGGDGHDMSRDMDAIDRIRAGPTAGGKNPEEMSPQELHAVLWQVLTFRDSVVKKISKTIEKIPGLGPLIERLMESISVFVFTTLEPFLKPILKTATTTLSNVSGEVINSHDQYEVFNDPRASDPTHSFLSKDHFNLILNEPAGRLARLIVQHSVNLVVKAWDNPAENVHAVTEEITQCMFHPDFHNPNSKIQREMLQSMKEWFNERSDKQSVLQRLTKQAVRDHKNIRLAGEGGTAASEGTFAEAQGQQFQHTLAGYAQNIPGGQAIFNATGFGNTKPQRAGGEASSFFGGGATGPQSGGGGGAYSHYDHKTSAAPPSTYGAPSGPPPSSYTTAPSYPGNASTGYAPAYISPPTSSGPPSFPGSSAPPFTGFPGAPSGSQTSSYGAPPGPPPGFNGGPDHRQGHHGDGNRGGFGFPGAEPFGGTPSGFPSATPGFPDTNTGPGFPSFPGGPNHGGYNSNPPGW